MRNLIIKYVLSFSIILGSLLIVPFFPLKIEANNQISLNDKANKIDRAEIQNVVRFFVESLKENNVNNFKKIVSPKGLIVIRNFVSGGYGARGKNIRDYYTVAKISRKMVFPVQDEIPINPRDLFEGTIKLGGKKIDELKIKGPNFNLKDDGRVDKNLPTTNKIIKMAAQILANGKTVDTNPCIFILDDREFALAESQLIEDIPIGGWAIFENMNNQYYLRAIIDFL